MKLSNSPDISEHPSHEKFKGYFDQLCGTCDRVKPAHADAMELWRLGWVRYFDGTEYVWICAGCEPKTFTPPHDDEVELSADSATHELQAVVQRITERIK